MTQEEFIQYVKGVIDSEMEKARMDLIKVGIPNSTFEFTGPIKLIKDALEKIGNGKEDEVVCPKCGEKENFHFNYDYSKSNTPVEDILCNECGSFFSEDVKWHEIEEEYHREQYPPFGGPFTDALKPFEWLKLYYNAPTWNKRAYSSRK